MINLLLYLALLFNGIIVEITGPPPYLGKINGICADCTDPIYFNSFMIAYYRIDAIDHSIHYFNLGNLYAYQDGVPIYQSDLIIYPDEWELYSQDNCIELLDMYAMIVPRDGAEEQRIILYPEEGRNMKVCKPKSIYLSLIRR